MKFISIRFISLFGLLILAIILPLLSAINAYEDPAEAAGRTLRAGSSAQIPPSSEVSIEQQRANYRARFPFRLERWSEPQLNQVLQTYPVRTRRLIDDLEHFGTRGWNPTDNLKTHFRSIDAAITALTLGPFHPHMIERQNPEVRQVHYDVLRQFTSWLNAHQTDLENLEGIIEARKRIGRYERALRAANIARQLPHIV